jgi:hypothetical protein
MVVIALDSPSTTSAVFQVRGREISLSQGVVHLAESSRAILVPVSVLPQGTCRFEIRFGVPVPDALIDKRNSRPAIQFMLDQLWGEIQEDPSLMGWSTLLTLNDRVNPNIILWP